MPAVRGPKSKKDPVKQESNCKNTVDCNLGDYPHIYRIDYAIIHSLIKCYLNEHQNANHVKYELIVY